MSRKYVPRTYPPSIFNTKSCWGIFIPLTPPEEDSSCSRNIEIKVYLSTQLSTVKCLPRTRTSHINGTCQILRRSTLLSHPTTSLRSISPLRARPPPTMRSWITGREGVITRENIASHLWVPPTFCTKAKVAKVGAYLWDTMVNPMKLWTEFDSSVLK